MSQATIATTYNLDQPLSCGSLRAEDFRVCVPEGQVGDYKIERFSVSEDQAKFANLRGRYIKADKYTGLYQRNNIWMSDTPAEIGDHIGFCRRASGDVLVTGLGLGMSVSVLMRLAEVKSVTVIEKSQEVIELVGNHLQESLFGSKLRIVNADAYEYKPAKDERYDCAWHDIWMDLCTDNLEEITKLKRKWCRKVGMQEAWVEGLLRLEKRRYERSGSWR